MPPYSILNEHVVHKDIDHSLEGFSLPHIISKEEYVINNDPSQDILFEILRHEMMVMSCSQTMILVLCQVVTY